MGTAAERKRRSRQRQKSGLRVYLVEADEVQLSDNLVAGRYLSPLAADDPEEQRKALQRLIADLRVTRPDTRF